MTAALKDAIDRGDPDSVRVIVVAWPELAKKPIVWGDNGELSTIPLNYVANAPFHGTCSNGRQVDVARSLIAFGADVNDRGPDGTHETPLQTAVSLYEPGLAELFLDSGAELETRGGCVDDGTALRLAVHFGSTECVDMLVARGAIVEDVTLAAGVGDLDRVKAEVSPETATRAALYAATNDRTDVLTWLLENGADVNTTVDDATLLHWTAWWAAPGAAQLLIDRGADVERRDPKFEARPVDWARHRGGEEHFRGFARANADRLAQVTDVLAAASS